MTRKSSPMTLRQFLALVPRNSLAIHFTSDQRLAHVSFDLPIKSWTAFGAAGELCAATPPARRTKGPMIRIDHRATKIFA